ncbi:MgtC/SapB family protein [Sedimentibacter sp. MB31-C6]|uniref:MgtC/SapB family protein n=1 Tax=Sedimentibacter sp. MB31-C6 TaxID=3109366 RepID=UPI002DDC9173|nr:MgtC/SapB family protein [Sedimentibacter sp. MB36-C1]WSI04272.1 MgtC/SapB family protein [Sedimentibacter sp. MB36-C1]
MSLIIGGLLGLERSRKSRPAGFRTYMLVCLSSTLVMMTNQFIFETYSSGDPARLGAQVISGIGFLGVGTIIVTRKNQVKGLTTAAGLWVAACLGLSIGIGFYAGAIIVGIFVLLIMTLFKSIENWLLSTNKFMTIYASFPTIENFDGFVLLCKKLNFKINDIEMTRDNNSKEFAIVAIINLESNERYNHMEIIQKLSSYEGLHRLEEL